MPSTIVDPPSAGEDSYISEDPSLSSGKKYLTLHVPNFSQNMHSYLCLGAVPQWFTDANPSGPPADPSIHGQKLANMVLGFCDDDRAQDYREGTALNEYGGPSNAPTPPPETIDDVGRSIPPMPPPGDTTPAGPFPTTSGTPPTKQPTLMQNESAILQQKGGWRDHSDGNRITTTFGDKVEVIRGNYKLLVLGRQDDPSQQVAGWDVSGGLVSSVKEDLNYPAADPGATPLFPPFPQPKYGGQQALSTQYTWQQDSDGNWGWTQITQTGTYAEPKPTPDNPATNAGAGNVIQYTWVDQMDQYFGSGKPGAETTKPDPLKTSVSKLWAETIVAEQHAIQKLPIAQYAEVTPTLTTIATSDGTMLTNITSVSQMISNTMAAGPLPTDVPDPSVAMITNVTAGRVPDSVLHWDWVTPTPDADGNPMVVYPGMNSVTASQGQMNTRLHSGADMINETSSDGAMSLIVTAGSVADQILSLPTYLPQHTNTTAPGSLNETTAAAGYVDNLLFSGLNLTNTMQSNGNITNEAKAGTNLYNYQLSASQEDLTITAFHIMLELSAMLLDMKPGVHADIHNIHFDCHMNHLDFHLGGHVTLDLFKAKAVDVGEVGVAPFWAYL
jgi:hypothetical protein